MHELKLIAGLLNIMEEVIRNNDLVVDVACNLESIMFEAAGYLSHNGWDNYKDKYGKITWQPTQEPY